MPRVPGIVGWSDSENLEMRPAGATYERRSENHLFVGYVAASSDGTTLLSIMWFRHLVAGQTR